MKGYSARDISTMLGLSVSRIRSYVSAGLLAPERGDRGELRFTFHDLVILRTAKELLDARIPPRKVSRALTRLREQLPSGRPITAVRIAADGDRVVVRDGEAMWQPESGQALFDFAVAELETTVAPFAKRAAEQAISDDELDADGWYDLGCELEIGAADEAEDAYRRALEQNPLHCDAMVNLGRLLQERGELEAAEQLYRAALGVDRRHAIAWFNLGVLLEEEERREEAIDAYRAALEHDPDSADAHYNLAGLYEALGRKTLAFRHLKTYKSLIDRDR